MKKLKQFTSLFILIFFLSAKANALPTTRPPQYVIIAFDGAFNNDLWKESLQFAKQNSVKFTYFMSGVYFLLDENQSNYIEPNKGVGKSNIGFAGDSKVALVNRVSYVNQAYDEGHEIASHANGHFDATLWSLENWELEFREFTHLIFDVFNQKGLEHLPFFYNPYHFAADSIIGFRAPFLASNPNMYKALRNHHFKYDTSQTNSMKYWPKNSNEIWNFPLADIRIFNTAKQTITMDYNFYTCQSGAQPDLKNSEKYRKEMFKTYLGYFYTNYYGNRAPIHIGHHFSKWNGGAYWKALGDFTKQVCNRPEVRCVSYKSLLKFMETLPPATLAEYQKGNFPKLPISPEEKSYIDAVAPLDFSLSMKKINFDEIKLSIHGKDSNFFPQNTHYLWLLNDKEFSKV